MFSCGKDKTDTTDTVNFNIEGSWESICISFPSNSQKSRLVITKNLIKSTITLYSKQGCVSAGVLITIEDSYKLGKN